MNKFTRLIRRFADLIQPTPCPPCPQPKICPVAPDPCISFSTIAGLIGTYVTVYLYGDITYTGYIYYNNDSPDFPLIIYANNDCCDQMHLDYCDIKDIQPA